MITKQQIHPDVYSFVNDRGVEPIRGTVLQILDKTTYEIYDSVVTRIDSQGIWIKRDNETQEQLLDMSCLQTSGEYLEDWLDDEDD